MSDINQIKTDASARMEKTLESLKADFGGLRAGRAHVSLLDGIMVEAYGSLTPIAQIGTVSTPDPRTLSVSVWDKSLAKNVEKALRESDLGLNPAVDGTLIRIPIPPLSEERRKELSKVASKYAEQNKVAIRNIRRDSLDEVKKLKKDNLISEDEEKRAENDIQKLTDDAVKKVDEMLAAKEMGVKYLTLYAFSTENWKRPKEEVDTLMDLLRQYLSRDFKELNDNNIRICFIGERDMLAADIVQKMEELETLTQNNSAATLQVALSYGSRAEIIHAVKKIAEKIKNGDMSIKDIDEKTISDMLYTKNVPDPDILIRTSGEQRLSNYLLWQLAYTELFFTKTAWPDFTANELKEIIDAYQTRERRYGKA